LEAAPQLATNLLPRLFTEKEVPEVQAAAFDVLLRLRAVDTVGIVLRSWPTLWPVVKERAIRLLVDRRENHEALLAALESGRIQSGELSLDLEQRRRLLRSPIPAIRARAEKFWKDEEYSNRKAAVEEWIAKLPATGDAGRGSRIFGDLCARCHKLGNVGRHVGPDLAGTAHRSVEDLLSNIGSAAPGAAAVAVSAPVANAPAAAAKNEEKPKEEEADVDMGGLFGNDY
jgi:mono/diheme cytochrome c family protein